VTLQDLRELSARAEVPPPVGGAWSDWQLGYANGAMWGRRLDLFGGSSWAICELQIDDLERLPNDESRVATIRNVLEGCVAKTMQFIVEHDICRPPSP